MSKIYLVVCDVLNGEGFGFEQSFLSFLDKDKALNYVKGIEEEYKKFSDWFEELEEYSLKAHRDNIFEKIDSDIVPREWKMQTWIYRHKHPEYKFLDNVMKMNPELKEIQLI